MLIEQCSTIKRFNEWLLAWCCSCIADLSRRICSAVRLPNCFHLSWSRLRDVWFLASGTFGSHLSSTTVSTRTAQTPLVWVSA